MSYQIEIDHTVELDTEAGINLASIDVKVCVDGWVLETFEDGDMDFDWSIDNISVIKDTEVIDIGCGKKELKCTYADLEQGDIYDLLKYRIEECESFKETVQEKLKAEELDSGIPPRIIPVQPDYRYVKPYFDEVADKLEASMKKMDTHLANAAEELAKLEGAKL